ncbi:MAG: Bd3614 family nucleic acid deaminase [Planctomycetota bacterium]
MSRRAPPYAVTPEDRAITDHLRRRHPGEEVAWVDDGELLLHAHRPIPTDPSSAASVPWSPVIDLIQGIASIEPGRSHARLRRRLFSSVPLRMMDAAFVKVQAKRCAVVLPGDAKRIVGAGVPSGRVRSKGPKVSRLAHAVDVTPAAEEARAAVRTAHRLSPPPAAGLPMEVAREWALRARREGELHRRDRPVGAVLELPNGEIALGAMNRGGEGRSLHAEVNLAQMWWARRDAPIPKGSRVHVTLQCCRMCAAVLVALSEDARGPEVIFGEPDPGRFARETLLQTFDRERPFDRPSDRLADRSTAEGLSGA